MARIEYRTPGTRLWWGSVREWAICAKRLDARRSSEARNIALAAHVEALPLELIAVDADRIAIEAALDLLMAGPPGLCRPPRGLRADAPHTPRIMALYNRCKMLEQDKNTITPGANWLAIHGNQGRAS
ncbi:hypothetical protein [Roseobacter sp. HKCCA0434]|uniref:hypothetical protein n=1 Tax=Roseobacter sp. HKCCA0434 TaxID=3079297 RepID=UPI002905AD2F|nr:hypothetical protein [Roseobacter sp. HKCCA0434]